MINYPKKIKRSLREFAALAHEREIREHLARLALEFARWEAGELGTWDLTDLIHTFHNGPNRELYTFYNGAEPAIAVAHGLLNGFLREDEIPPEVLEAIGPLISTLRGLRSGPEDLRPDHG